MLQPPQTSARFDQHRQICLYRKVPIQKQGAEDRRPLRPGDLGDQVTLTVGGARYPLLLPVGAIPAPVRGYSVASGRGRARP
jgi:hypothetical protein